MKLKYQLVRDGDVVLSAPKSREGLDSAISLAERHLYSRLNPNLGPPEFQLEIHLWDSDARRLIEVVHQWIDFTPQFPSPRSGMPLIA